MEAQNAISRKVKALHCDTRSTLMAGALFCAASLGMAIPSLAHAYELGAGSPQLTPGVLIGSSAAVPPTGIYMFERFFTSSHELVGPGAVPVNGQPTKVNLGVATTGFLFVPGWSVLGATYDAVITLPFSMSTVGPLAPGATFQTTYGMRNTYIAPIELSWNVPNSGFYVKTGVGVHVPDGTLSGPAGLSNAGNPWYTIQPSLSFSYLKDGWNLTGAFSEEFNTKNSITGYKSGNVVHADFTFTKDFDRWTIGPVAYYAAQISDDQSSSYYNKPTFCAAGINCTYTNRYSKFAAGGLVGYNFGPANIKVWALQDISATATGGNFFYQPNSAVITKGFEVFASLGFRIWAPDAPARQERPQLFFK